MPNGNAYVRRVKSLFRSENNKDVTIMNGLAKQTGVGYRCLGNIAIALPRDRLLHPADTCHPFRMRRQLRIVLRVRGHPVDFQMLYGSEWRIGRLDISNNAHLLIIVDPYREIMLAVGIRHFAIQIAYAAQLGKEVCKAVGLMPHALVESEHGFHKRGTVEFTRVDHQVFVEFTVERLCHVGHVQELPAEVNHPVSRRWHLSCLGK